MNGPRWAECVVNRDPGLTAEWHFLGFIFSVRAVAVRVYVVP
jgi:hypothetical protein